LIQLVRGNEFSGLTIQGESKQKEVHRWGEPGMRLGSALKILLVDDDPLKASVRKSIFEKRFSDVLRVADAAEALCLLEQPHFARSLSLVVTGHHSAGIGVPAFVAELHARIPLLPVLVLGDSREQAPGDYADANVSFLARPFGADEMLSAASHIVTQNERKTA